MPKPTYAEKKQEFKENFNTMTESKEGLAAYNVSFADQTNAENLLATGGGENLGSIENELAILSAMNEIRISERQQAFTEDKLFASDLMLSMRDTSYIEAAGELNRRKNIKSHRYDKTRKSRMETAQETMNKANDKIRDLKKRLGAENGPVPTKMQKVKAMEDIYDNIRVADRNFAEAMSLNKEEETKLKNRAELTFRSSLKRMYEREMEGLAEDSPDYRKIKRKYDENLRYYNELMRPVLEERAKREAENREDSRVEVQQDSRRQSVRRNTGSEQNVRRQSVRVNRESQQSVSRQQNARRQSLQPRQVQMKQVPLDKEAEENVSTNVKLFSKFCESLNGTKYGRSADPLWAEMKAKAASLTEGWEDMTDIQRGKALSDVLVSANKFLCKGKLNSGTDEQRAAAAKEFRNFFKTTLFSMSANCRVLALDEILKEVDRIEDDGNTPEELKKQNTSIFAEMAREKYAAEHKGDKKLKEALKEIDDFHFRHWHYAEKSMLMPKIIKKIFGNTKDFFLANYKFGFERLLGHNMLADNFRLDRYGRVLPEDQKKFEGWKKLFSDLAKCDTEGALKIQRQWFERAAALKIDKDFLDEKGMKRKGYELKGFRTFTLSFENLASLGRTHTPAAMKEDLKNWNQAHKDKKDQISEKDIIKIDIKTFAEQGKKIAKLPVFQKRADFLLNAEMNFTPHVYYLKGSDYGSANYVVKDPDEFINLTNHKDFVKGNKNVYMKGNTPFLLIHKDGTAFDQKKDVREKDKKVIQNKQNPLVLRHEIKKEGLIKELDDNKGFFEKKLNVEKALKRVNAREDRINTIERGAMEKIKALVKNKKLGAEGQNELRELEALFEEFAKEAQKQIMAKETLMECDPDSVDKEGTNAFYKEAVKYYGQKKNMNVLFEKLEAAQSSFIKKYAGNSAYTNWKKELDSKRKESRKSEDAGAGEGLSALQKIKMRTENEQELRNADYFTDEETKRIKEIVEGEGRRFSREEMNRVANVFILPVHRDFIGAYLTEQDRKNADFNKRYKEAVLSNNKEKMKELSREFTEKTLKTLTKLPSPEELQAIDSPEKLEKKLTSGKIIEKHTKLCMLSNVMKDNSILPEMKAGLNELKAKDKKQYDEIEKKLMATDGYILTMYLQTFGYDCERHKNMMEKGVEGVKMVIPAFIDSYRTEYNK